MVETHTKNDHMKIPWKYKRCESSFILDSFHV